MDEGGGVFTKKVMYISKMYFYDAFEVDVDDFLMSC